MNKIFLVVVLIVLSIFKVNGQEAPKPLMVYKVSPMAKGAGIKEVPMYEIFSRGKVNLITYSMYFKACPPCVYYVDTMSPKLKSMITKGKLNYSVVVTINDSSLFTAYLLKGFMEKKTGNFPYFLTWNIN